MIHYLRWMGIDVWRFRTPGLFEYYRYDLLNSQNHQVGILLADAVFQNKAEAQLVEKIVKATKKQFKGGLQSGLLEPDKLEKCVILLGSRVICLINSLKRSRIIRSHSPADLLQNAELKVQTWNALKAAIQLMRE
ncbi:MAG: hypothetical protein AB8Y25_00325 [Coxiella endosymbiont of Haemaphysalis qinghaiensis]